ncbi:FHA domain-containing protein [Synechococcus sp. HK05]|uniref:FHA domain-containing protein n=1 Tax=Synechococcus sp. HK05 TaxID=2725975 RepID=UPI001C37FB15|nr:FHA domain-containing protein [Synechococcus sp. HK05]MBV2350159.1 FHA domain-containing protein [Synechococcus sp. HK05]
MSTPAARLVLAADRRKVAPLDPANPLTIGRAASNSLCLTNQEGVSEHHAVVRFSRSQGWLVCNWQSDDGTFLEGRQVHQCKRLEHGDEIRLGRNGPVLVFESAAAVKAAAAPAPVAAAAPRHISVGEQQVAVADIRSAAVQSLPLHPHIFSWWLLLCLGGLLLLPFPLVFWPLEAGALAGWILMGSRKQHALVLVLRDGRAIRHGFANRRTALAHRNGIRQAIGQAPTSA